MADFVWRFLFFADFLQNAVLRIACLIITPRRADGQNVYFWDLPVKQAMRLRAKQRFLGFARKTQPPVTGKMAISEICP